MKLAALLLIAGAGLVHPQEILHSTTPRLIHKVEPEYTKEALDAKLEGVVGLSTVIDVDGVPTEIKVIHGIGMGLDEKAIKCLAQWRFSPATQHSEPVPIKVTIQMNFRILNKTP
jgi:periplasmic protein TonB